MQVTRKNTAVTEVLLTISASEADLSPLKQATLRKLAPQVKVQGFRAGKVPLSLVESNLNPSVLQNEFLQVALNRLYNAALNRENLRPVAEPQVELKKFVPFTALEFTATISVVGEIKLTDYKKLKVSKPTASVTDKDVEEVLASLLKRSAERKSVERTAKAGDELIIDFKGTDDKGQAIAGAEGKGYPLALGSDTFIPGFESNLIGLKAGEEKSFKLTFPKDYGVKTLQNKKVDFAVKVGKVQELIEPKADDSFAAKIGPFKTIKELKQDIKRQLTLEREREAEQAYEQAILELLAKKSSVNLPKQLVDEQVERLENEERQNLIYRGQTWDEHLQAEGVTAEEHKAQKRPAAEERVKIGLILSEIAEREKVTVNPDELKQQLDILKAQYKDEQAQKQLDLPEVQRDIIARLITQKTLDKLKEYAK